MPPAALPSGKLLSLQNKGRAGTQSFMTTADDTEIRKYELMVIFSGSLTEKDFEAALHEVRKMIKEASKSIFYENLWGRKDMAYRMKKDRTGYYVVFDFEAEPKAIVELRSNVRLSQQVLRHMLVILPQDYQSEKYKEQMLSPQAMKREDKRTGRSKMLTGPETGAGERTPVAAASPGAPIRPTIAGKEDQERLKQVEKKLEEILDNPNLDIK